MKSVWSIDIAAPRERVWRALTTPGVVQPFYFGSRFEADLRPGGGVRYTTPKGERTFIEGRVIEVESDRRFVHEFRFLDLQEPAQRVTFDLEDVGGGTRMTIRHEGLEAAPKHAKRVTPGWDHILSNLKAWLERGKLPLASRLQHAAMGALAPLMPQPKQP